MDFWKVWEIESKLEKHLDNIFDGIGQVTLTVQTIQNKSYSCQTQTRIPSESS